MSLYQLVKVLVKVLSTVIPCKMMAPILESLSAEYRNKANVLFIDVREDQPAAQT